MKYLVYVPINGFLFWRISRTASLKRCIGQYGRYFSVVKAVQESRQKTFCKPVLDSKKQKCIQVGKRFSSNAQDSFALMDFDVWTHPRIFQIFRDFYYFNFVLKDLDSFSLAEFVHCSAKALQVVTTLLSELRFPELDGLLTPECKEQVKNNLRSWSRPEVSILAFQPEHLMKSIPCEILVFSDENNKDKKFVEIRVIHYVWLEYSPKFGNKESVPLMNKVLLEANPTNRKLHMGAVYNCKFIREITKGITDQWIINKINLKCFPDVFFRF